MVQPANPSFTQVTAGFGPRHIAINFQSKTVFLLCELESIVLTYQINENTGELTEMSMKHILDETPIPSEEHHWPYQAGSEIELHPNGKWLYLSNRGLGSMLVFEVIDAHNLKFTQVYNFEIP